MDKVIIINGNREKKIPPDELPAFLAAGWVQVVPVVPTDQADEKPDESGKGEKKG